MTLDIMFQPNEENEQRFNVATQMTINKKRNTPATIAITLPQMRAAEDLEAYSLVRISYDDFVIFDGYTQEKAYAKDKVNLKGYDQLWEFIGKKRSFFQTTSARPDELFKNAFDQDEIFDSFTGYWETYNTPWLSDFDASTHVIPAESAPFTDFFDGENTIGTDLMKRFADLSYRGNKFTYYYWYEYINGTKYLFFQPDGWGKIWEFSSNANLTVVDLKETLKGLYNNIVVWGKNARGLFPHGGDYWTEDNLDGWNVVNSGLFTFDVALSPTQSIVGEKSLEVVVVAGSPGSNGSIFRDLREAGNDYVNLENLLTTNLKFYISSLVTEFTVVFILRLEDNTGKTTLEYLDLSTTGSWVTLSIPDTSWGFVTGGFDWSKVSKMYFNPSCDTGSDNITIYLDGFYFHRAPIKSQNISPATGYDPTSFSDYKLRTFDVIYRPLKTVADCNAYAANLLPYYKDPQYQASISIPGFTPLNLNDQIKGTLYGKQVTLPIDTISWTFNEKGAMQTKATLGTPRLKPEDILKKQAMEVMTNSFDRGLTYNVY